MNCNIISNYKVILWDFDGVIVDSNEIRVYGFREILKKYPKDAVDELIDFHSRNGGLSRYVKFRYFFKEILGQEIHDEIIEELANSFSIIMLKCLKNTKLLIEESLRCIQALHKAGRTMHIVSGSDERELLELTDFLGLSPYFSTITGSPTPKDDLVKSIINNSMEQLSSFCLIGDSINDFQAARYNGIKFFGFNNDKLLLLDEYLERTNIK